MHTCAIDNRVRPVSSVGVFQEHLRFFLRSITSMHLESGEFAIARALLRVLLLVSLFASAINRRSCFCFYLHDTLLSTINSEPNQRQRSSISRRVAFVARFNYFFLPFEVCPPHRSQTSFAFSRNQPTSQLNRSCSTYSNVVANSRSFRLRTYLAGSRVSVRFNTQSLFTLCFFSRLFRERHKSNVFLESVASLCKRNYSRAMCVQPILAATSRFRVYRK